MRKTITKTLKKHRAELFDLSKKIHDNPELGFEEKRAAKWQKSLLSKWGFKIESPVAELKTAYRATWGNSGPTVCFIAEYDALPENGHACGHNLIATGGLTCGLLLKTLLEEENIPGTVVVMGTPGEEGKGGKVIMVRKKAFKDIDIVLEAHPFYRTIMDPGCLSVDRYEIDFYGYSSHAAVNPEEGKNALDAVMLLFQGVNAWRQHLDESSRIHGIVTEGGAAPNIIPDYASCIFYLRAKEMRMIKPMYERFENIVKGSALMTDTKHRINKLEHSYASGLANKPLNEEFYRIANDKGLEPNHPVRGGRVSTDFGNVSQIVPGIHVYFKICDKQVPLHSLEFNRFSGTKTAFNRTMTVSEVLTRIAHRYCTDPAFREQVQNDFNQKKFPA